MHQGMSEEDVRRRLYGADTRTGTARWVRFNDVLWLDWDAIGWDFTFRRRRSGHSVGV